MAGSALAYDLNGLKSTANRHLLSFLNIFPVRFLSFFFLLSVTPCLVVAVQPCIDLIPIKKKKKRNRNTESVNKSKPNFFIRPIEKLVLAIHDIMVCLK